MRISVRLSPICDASRPALTRCFNHTSCLGYRTLNSNQQQILKEHLGNISTKDRKALLKQAAELREAAQSKAKATDRYAAKGKPDPTWTIERWLLHLLEPKPQIGERARVVQSFGNRIVVRQNGTENSFSSPGGAICGDEVVIDGQRVSEIRPRRTVLTRRDPSTPHGTLAIVANIDVAVIMVSVGSPPLHPRLLDRYLAALAGTGIEPAIVVNKVDESLCNEDAAKLRPYRDLGIAIFLCSATRGLGLEEIRAHLTGRLSAFLGHSGVGKSSLLNALVGKEVAKVGSVTFDTGKGAHTTTSSSLREEGGIQIIDTPGIRQFAPSFRSRAEVQFGFQEIHAAAQGCLHPDCRHQSEPGCEVLKAIQCRRIHTERYQSYLRLIEEL